MAYAPPPESNEDRRRREERERCARALGCSLDELYLQEQLERVRAELRPLAGPARRARLETELQRKREFLELCVAGEVGHTLDERWRMETAYAYLERILGSPLESFLEADAAYYAALRAACPWPGADRPPAPPPV